MLRPPRERPYHRLFLRRLSPALLVLALAVLAGGAYYGYYASAVAASETLAAELVAEADSAFETVPRLTSAEAQALRRYRNDDHLDRARALGVAQIPDRDAAAALAADHVLVPLADNPFYEVAPMDYSVPYVTKNAAYMLEIIGRRFHEALREEGLPPFRYVITSATRTEDDQRRLRRVNVNAASVSSHTFGTTVDIHYGRFSYAAEADTSWPTEGVVPELVRERLAERYTEMADAYDERLKAILGRVLRELQQEGKAFAIYERRQPVYHITTATLIDDPSPGDPIVPMAPPVDPSLGAALLGR